LRVDGSIVTRGFRQKLDLHRTCEPLVQTDFGSLARNTLDPMTVGECLGLCGNWNHATSHSPTVPWHTTMIGGRAFRATNLTAGAKSLRPSG
jgi:hypothetical protein